MDYTDEMTREQTATSIVETEVHRIADRITDADERGLISTEVAYEARIELESLHAAFTKELEEFTRYVVALRGQDMATEERPVEATRYRPSDYDLRVTAMHAANGNASTARELYEFLKAAPDA